MERFTSIENREEWSIRSAFDEFGVVIGSYAGEAKDCKLIGSR